MATWLILELGISMLGTLGKATSRDATTLSSSAKRLPMRAREDLELAMKDEGIAESDLMIATLQA